MFIERATCKKTSPRSRGAKLRAVSRTIAETSRSVGAQVFEIHRIYKHWAPPAPECHLLRQKADCATLTYRDMNWLTSSDATDRIAAKRKRDPE
jgi:hypothetical protein